MTDKRSIGNPEVTPAGDSHDLRSGERKAGHTNDQGQTAFADGWFTPPAGNGISRPASSSGDATWSSGSSSGC